MQSNKGHAIVKVGVDPNATRNIQKLKMKSLSFFIHPLQNKVKQSLYHSLSAFTKSFQD
jgi:hypothetical protein